MTQPDGPLVARLKQLLKTQEEAATPKVVEAPPLPPTPGEIKRAKAEEVMKRGHQLRLPVAERLALLEAAAIAAGVSDGEAPPVSGALAPQIPVIAALLRERPAAAKAVASVVVQDREAREELEALRAAIAGRELDEMYDLDVERSKGKFYYLVKVHYTFRAFPLLAGLFDAPAGQAPALGTAPLGGFRAGVRTEPLTREDHLEVRGKALLKDLEPRILILRAAVNDVVPNRVNLIKSLPPHAAASAQQIANLIRHDTQLLRKVQEPILWFHEARLLIERKPIKEPERLRALLTALGSLSRRLRGFAALEALFAP